MKRSIVLTILFLLICSFTTAIAQDVKTIVLSQENTMLVSPSKIVLRPGDTLQFEAEDGEFAICIWEAIRYFDIDQYDLKLRINSATNRLSDEYTIKGDADADEVIYVIYCISNNSWPDAPPKIIVVSK